MVPFYKAFIKLTEKLVSINGPVKITHIDECVVRVVPNLKLLSVKTNERLVFYYEDTEFYIAPYKIERHRCVYFIMRKIYHNKN